MKFKALAVLIFIVLFLSVSGCAKEEERPFSGQKASVKKPIVRPSPAKSPISEPLPESNDDHKQDIAVKAETAVVEKTAEIKKNTSEKEKIQKKETEGVYISKKGDTLSIIAGKENVMGDSLKWPMLYRMNIKGLADMGAGADLPDRPLPEGIKLDLVTDEMLKRNLKAMPEKFWVINILSSTAKEKIIPVAVKLLKEGYYVYISKATVKGKEWLRLRVGFFQSRNVSDIKGKRVKDILNIQDIWATKIGKDEFQEYAGYHFDL